MRRNPDSQSRLGACLDIPVHRASVGGMALASGSQMPEQFRPYVYRGWGYDLFPDEPVYAPAPPKPKRKRRPPKPRPARQPRYERVPWELPPPSSELVEERDRALLIEDESTWGNWSRPPKPKPKPKHTGSLRPSPGWTPTTGVDIDAWLEEYLDED